MRRSVPSVATVKVEAADVQAFCRVVDLGSVTQAARTLGETKSTVSRRVDRLEAAVGVPLLQRSGRGVAPTDAGLLYRERAGAALEQLADAASVVRDQSGRPSGHLRITAPLALGGQFLGHLTASFLAEHPEVTLEYVLTDEVLSLDRDRIDVALRFAKALPDSTLLATRLPFPDTVLVASPAYVARRGAPQSPEELDDHTLLAIPTRGTTTPVRFVHRSTGDIVERVLRGHVTCHDPRLLQEAAVQGAGIAMGVYAGVSDALEDGSLVEILPDWTGPGGNLWMLSRPAPVPPKVRAFRDHLAGSLALRQCPSRSGKDLGRKTDGSRTDPQGATP